MGDRANFTAGIKNKKYIDNYIEQWLKMETLDKPYVECEVCGYASNASIHQHLLIPKESSDNRIIHLCANCYYELRALMDRYNNEKYEEAFEELKDKKKHYRDMNKRLERVEI